jgi:uncharacterized protein
VTRAFLIPVASLLRHPGASKDVTFRAPFDPDGVLASTWEGAAEVVPGADVEVRLTLTSYLGGVAASGVLLAPWRASCRRCASDASGVLEARVAERFAPGAGPDDDDAYPLDDETVDLTALVRDAVVLELPLAPLCRDDCAGLCATCGQDRNEATCTCQPTTDPRWATLDALRVPDQA